jgi:hypothetical protein
MIADASWLVILSRWLHVISACLLVGATFFYAVLPNSDPPEGARARRSLQMLVRVTIVLLIATGIYNLILNREGYHRTLPLSHGLLGTHVLLALAIVGLLEAGLSARRVEGGRRGLLRIAVVLLFVTVAVASSLKYVREHPSPSTANGHSMDKAGQQ